MSKASPFSIVIDPYVGKGISDVAISACELANKIGFDVSFDFNGRALVVHPGDEAADVVQMYFRLSQDRPKGVGDELR